MLTVINGESIATISVAVVVATQLLKWFRWVNDDHGAWVVIVVAFLAEVLYYVSYAPADQPLFVRQALWPFFIGLVDISAAAAGIFGFTRAASSAVTSINKPPPGPGENVTVQANP